MALRGVLNCTWLWDRRCLSVYGLRRRWRVADATSAYLTYRKSDFSSIAVPFGEYLSGVPVTVTLPRSQEPVIIEQLSRDGIHEAFQLVESAARTGDNVGVDEFPALKDLVDQVGRSFAIAIRSVWDRTLNAVILLGPCHNARTIHPRLASLQVITSERFARDAIWRDSAELAVDFARQLPVGYSACVTEVFSANAERIVAYGKQAFTICACVPMAGRLSRDERVSYSPSYLMYREIGPPYDTSRTPASDLIHLPLDFTGASTDEEANIATEQPPLKTRHPSTIELPVSQFQLSHSGISVLLRPLRPEETERYYGHFRSAAEAEEGFSIDEFPTASIFWEIFKRHENLVIETASTGDWVAVMCLSRSLFSRGRAPIICDGSLIVAPKFRSSGVGSQLLATLFNVAKDLGYKGMFSDTPVYNVASIGMAFRNRMVFSGTLRRVFYSARHGWTDVILLYRAFDDK